MNKNATKKHLVLVPLTSFYLSDSLTDEESPAKIACSWNIPNTDIKLIKLSKVITLSKNSENPTFDEDIIIEEATFKIQTVFPAKNICLRFNSGFLFSFTQEDPDSLIIFPHTFENKIRNPLTFLRLFCKGDLFAPYGFVGGKDIIPFFDFGQNFNDGYSYLYQKDVEDFLLFYRKYSILAENLRKKALENPGTIFESWYKRVNNGIYFFGQTYFTSEKNYLNPEAKDKNNLRLIYLCTALDALIGTEKPSGKKLAKKTDLILCNLTGAISIDIEKYYKERSKYIHADPDEMTAATLNKTIEKFSVYIQKIILMSLELFNDPDFVEALTQAKQKHWFSFYEKQELYKQYSIKKITREAFGKVFLNKDGYDLADRRFIESKINAWSQE